MSGNSLRNCTPLRQCDDTQKMDALLQPMSARERVRWSLDNLSGNPILTSSFGAQSAVALHLVLQQQADIPVVLIDTGYLFPETYRFIDTLRTRLDVKLEVYRSELSPAWQEARFGERWQQGQTALSQYNDENKVQPMKRALEELNVGIWFAGLRRSQSNSRAETPFVECKDTHWKVHPLADWTDKDIFNYLKAHDLPYHPLWEQGYISIGDQHTTLPIHAVDNAEQTRFFGNKRECGLHEIGKS
jgi:phosphoadenosine phosphosulfate reductase